MKHHFLTLSAVIYLSLGVASAEAQRASPDQFFRPVTSSDLVTKLPPRLNQNKLLAGNERDFLSFDGSGGCPETVLIGSVDGDTEVFGGVDIDVVIENDIIINCGGL